MVRIYDLMIDYGVLFKEDVLGSKSDRIASLFGSIPDEKMNVLYTYSGLNTDSRVRELEKQMPKEIANILRKYGLDIPANGYISYEFYNSYIKSLKQ